MMVGPVDFAAVQWARRISARLETPDKLSAEDQQKIASLLEHLASLRVDGVTPTSAQVTVLLQNLYTKNLTELCAQKGGLSVEFKGGGYEYERFLLREDGRVPNYRYESKKAR
jgi:hypothetical protein